MISRNMGLNWEEFHLMLFDASPFRLQAAVAIAFAKATVSFTIIPSLMLAAVMSGGLNMTDDHEVRRTRPKDFNRTIPLHHMAKEATVTLNMLLAHLGPNAILSAPKRARGAYRWAVDITDPAVISDASFQEGLMFIGPADAISSFIETRNLPLGSLFIAITEEDEAPSHLPQRSLVIKGEQDYLHYVKRIQGLFLTLWLWEMELSHIVYEGEGHARRGKLQKVVDTQCFFAPEFVCITDTGFNLIAASKDIDPPAGPYTTLVTEGCYSPEQIAFLKREVLPRVGPRNTTVICEPDALCPFHTLHMPFFIDGAYLFHLTMVCREPELIRSREDIFSILSTHVAAICTEFWNGHLEVESSCHKILIRMLDNKNMNQDYIRTQLSATVIPNTDCFRLARYRINPELSFDRSREAIRAAVDLFPGHCYPFMYHDDLLVLICSPTNNLGGISLRKTLRRTTDLLFEPYGLVCALSQPFRYISDITFAYQQTSDAFRCERLLKAEYPAGYDGQGAFPAIPFEHTLQFMLVDGSIDPEMHGSVFANSIVQILDEEDRSQGGDFIGLLWEYLCTECNASDVAKKLNMHRNTVVYHINKFEKRFDLSLSLPMVRHRLYLDFVHHFAKNAH